MNKYIPGKRIKTWHRHSATAGSLRSYARFLAQDQNEDENSKRTSRDWLKGKGVQP